jgi:hypothetical protein
VRVYRVTQEARGGDVHDVLTQVLEDAASTDERGVGFFRWFADAGGRFIVSYQVRDTWGELARGDAAVWVHGPTFTGDGFQMKNLEVITDRRVYEPGDVALVMVNCNFPGTSVLVSLVAGQSILRHEVVRMTGKTAVLSIPIEKEHVPNMHLIASAIRNGEAYSVQQEVLVPPVSQLLDVEVSFDKPTYRPGEQGKVVVKVRDHRGQPTPARVALTCLDASLFYIQQDQTLDIRRFFYGHRRGRDIRSGTSTVAAFRGYLARDFQWGDHKPSGWAPAWYNRPGLITRVMARRAFGPEDDLGESSELLFDSDFEGGDRKKLRSLGGVAADAAAPGGRSRNAEVAGAEMPSAEAPSESTGIGAIEAAHVVATPIPEEIRTDFRDAARWAPDVQCDAEGPGVVDIPFPESLTTWRAKAIAWTADTLVGTGTANAVTTKDVLVRLQAPRFFVEGDRLTLSALVDNRTQQDLSGQVTIELAGGSLRLQGDAQHSVKLKALGQARMDWVCDVIGSGEASVTVRVVTDADRDAMRMLIPVQPWGARKTLTETSVLTNGGGATFSLDIPSERREGDSELTVILQPSLALTLLDALPYLIEYPYGCTEQTMSRFIPAVACAQTLKEAGTSLEEIASGRKNLPRAADQGSREAMISDRQLRDIVGTGLNRIASMQQGDGGWGWWRRDGSSPSLTSYVLLGLGIAEDAGYTLPSGIKERGLDFLGGITKNLENVHEAASIAWVLSRHGRSDADLLDRTFRARNELGVYGKALLCSALQLSALTDRAQVLVRNLADSVRTDPSNGTVHWDPSGPGWRWWDSPIETNAAVLQALLDVDPSNPWVPGLVKWLVRNRQGNHWSNTRDTALCVLALTRYARQAGELDPDYTVEVICAGDRKVFQVDRRNMFAFDNRFHLRGDAIPSGALPIEVRMTGRGRAYLTSSATFFTKEDHITGAGHELFIQRSFHRIEERAEDVVENGVKTRRVVESRIPLVQGADVRAGEIIEVKLALDAKNDYSHILIEDMKAAGFEPLQLRSGWNYEAGVCSNVEFRDERTAFFVTWLQQGTHELTYRLRAEVPGTLRALPARAESMYAPTFGGISDSFRVTVRDVEGL